MKYQHRNVTNHHRNERVRGWERERERDRMRVEKNGVSEFQWINIHNLYKQVKIVSYINDITTKQNEKNDII